jgi:hypothetical protein
MIVIIVRLLREPRLLYLRAKGVPPDAMTQALEQLDQAGTPIIQQE